MTNPYIFFSKIVCINLEESKQRKQHMNSLAYEYQIPLTFKTVQRHKQSPILGVFESHINIIKEAYANTSIRNVLIFEDDVIPTTSYSIPMLEKCIHFMRTNETWEMFFLGYVGVNTKKPLKYFTSARQESNIIKYTPLTTHAYCVSRRGMKKILSFDIPKQPIHLDVWYQQQKIEAYCVYPILFDQKWCQESTNTISPDNPLNEVIVRKYQCQLQNFDLPHQYSRILLLKYNLLAFYGFYCAVLFTFILLLLLSTLKKNITV